MRKWMFYAFTCLIITGNLAAQDKVLNDNHAVTRNVKNFHAISVSDGIDLIIKQGSIEAVAVSASEDKYRDRIRTEVDNSGVLKIYYEKENWWDWNWGKRKLKAYVSFVQLDMFHAGGGSDVRVEGTIHSDELSINVSSGARFDGDVSTGELQTAASSGGVINISGKATRLEATASSGAMMHGYGLVTDYANARASSGGGVQVTVNKELDAKASSGGGVKYKGDGLIRNISTGSGGSVSRRS